jgi:hypothetical protein
VTDGQLSDSKVGSINVETAVFRGRFFVTYAPPTPSCLGKTGACRRGRASLPLSLRVISALDQQLVTFLNHTGTGERGSSYHSGTAG